MSQITLKGDKIRVTFVYVIKPRMNVNYIITHFLTIYSMKFFVVSTLMCAISKCQDSLTVLRCEECKNH